MDEITLRHEFLKSQLVRFQDLIGKADLKATAVLALIVVLIATLAAQLPAFKFDTATASLLKTILASIAFGLLIAFLVSVVIVLHAALRVLFPRLDSTSDGTSTMFFGDVAKRTGAEYLALLEIGRVNLDAANNVCDLARILLAKYGYVQKTQAHLFVSAILWACIMVSSVAMVFAG
jgi:hypothetical protein